MSPKGCVGGEGRRATVYGGAQCDGRPPAAAAAAGGGDGGDGDGRSAWGEGCC